jgi:predicted transposase/invertase (TIGR01784 family)
MELSMSRLNPRVDFAFKKLFGSEDNKDILISFINSIVSEQDRVKDVSLTNPYNNKDFRGDKLSILDIKAIDESGRQYNIEMQMIDEVSYDQRALYYWSKIYTEQLKQGYHYDALKKTIGIHILNFNFFNEEKEYHNVFKILNARTYKACFEDFELHFIELEKFDKSLESLRTTLDRWTNFLKKAEVYSIDKIPLELSHEPAIKKAIEVLDTLYLTDEERAVYEAQLKWLRDEAGAVLRAEQKGEQKGRYEEKLEVARNLLSKGIDASIVAEATKLSNETIAELKKQALPSEDSKKL